MNGTELALSRLGFGGAGIGNLYAAMSDASAAAIVSAAIEAGVGYFDTAPHYGFGLSETRLGAALAGHPAQISTKVGRRLEVVASPSRERHGFVDALPCEPVFDYTYDGVMATFEASCRRLCRDHVDILLAHDLGEMTHGGDHPAHLRAFLDGGYHAMVALRTEGRVRAIGLGVNEVAICDTVLGHADLDVILLAGRYTLLEQAPLEGLLPRCETRGVGIMIGGPFNSGALVETGRIKHYNYETAPTEIVARVKWLRRICAAHGVPLAAAALQFPLAHPAVLNVIPGMASPTQVADAARWLDMPLPAALWADLKTEGLVRSDAPVPSEGAA